MSFFFSKHHHCPKVGLALGGGGIRGIAHIGVLKALARHQIPIDFIAGTSAGSIVGALYAAGIELRMIEKAAKELSMFKVVLPTLSMKGLNDSEIIHRTLSSYLHGKTFSQLNKPFAVIAMELRTGTECVLTSGDVSKAVQASCSFPVLYTPTEINGEYYIDGGFVDNVPVRPLKEMGAEYIIAVDVIPEVILNEKLEDIISIVNRAQDILLRVSHQRDLAGADILISPVKQNIRAFDLGNQKKLIDEGDAATERVIPEIKKKLGL